ncbi:hypothetical protein [Pelagibacterium lacus]|uniref:Peptidoglycan-binding protein n=1 Tax=Pelagibacterium lacus TaxID=2282655 RepID=A0A369VZX5_9HYPH|nr:hypothetical protein [Pelagibacterium lacus]RDE07946.1 hypothetical protein DVH29_14170 [Pelagibacterium lacus]
MNRIGKISATTALAATICALAPASAHDAPFHSGLSSIEALCRDLSAAAAWAEDWRCTNAAIFDNGTERQNIHDLRRQDFASLTEEEQAILRAADKVGALGLCNGSGGNSFLIEFDGRPAVITSAHLLIDAETGRARCSAEELREQISYLPNASYYDPDDPQANEEFTMRSVRLVTPPVNLEEAHASLMPGESDHSNTADWMVMFLREDISGDVMPAGHERGVFAYADLPSASQAAEKHQQAGRIFSGLYLIGVAPDRYDGLATNYQSGCNYRLDHFTGNPGILMHDCATIRGSSGSFVGLMQGSEIRFTGSHHYSLAGNNQMEGPSLELSPIWNSAVAASVVEAAQTAPRPELLAFDIQFELKQAGCYTGALDNQWGPGSRDALSRYVEASGLSLDGLEPTQPTFDLLRGRRPQDRVC